MKVTKRSLVRTEKRAWLARLRDPMGLGLTNRDLRELADILERQWFPTRSGPSPETRWQKKMRRAQALYRSQQLEREIKREMGTMKKPCRADAIETIAERHGVKSGRTIQRWIKEGRDATGEKPAAKPRLHPGVPRDPFAE